MHDLWGRRKLYVLGVVNPLACNEPLNFHFSIRTPVIKQLIILENAVVGKGLRYKRIDRKDFPIVKNHEA